MMIDGRAIAAGILDSLAVKVHALKQRGVTPHLAVILVGDDEGSLSYIKQKQKAADQIGAIVTFEHLPAATTPETLASAIAHFNADPAIHGLIVQRPVHLQAGEVGDILNSVHPGKDVDGLLPQSPFEVPVARAVLTILTEVHSDLMQKKLISIAFIPWLQKQHIAVIGRGETAGKPIAHLFQKYECATSILHSQTPDPKAVLKHASVIVSCVGKERVITKGMVSSGVILISVGLTRGTDTKLHGDYDTEEIADVASFYTPTPGGVGPVNVASLMQNVVDACILMKDTKPLT